VNSNKGNGYNHERGKEGGILGKWNIFIERGM